MAPAVVFACPPEGFFSVMTAPFDSDGSGSGTMAPAVVFACPPEGFFSVMTAPFDSDGSGSGTTIATAVAIFPVSQYLAYGVREASFFGNLFDVTKLDQGVDVEVDPAGNVTGRELALRARTAFHGAATCYDSDWTLGQAYALHRVCAVPGMDETTSRGCAAKVVGACSDPIGQPLMCQFDRRAVLYPPFYDDWEHCSDETGTVWSETLSVFLHGANDIVCPEIVCPPGQPCDLCLRQGH
jgi:hypothetical protein